MRFSGLMGLYAHLSALAAVGPLAFVSGMAARRTACLDDADAPAGDVVSPGLLPETRAPAGEAAVSLAAAHALLLDLLPAGPVDIYEPGGGSVSYLPQSLLERARVTVIDADPVQIARNRYADTLICGDVQRHWLPSASIDLVACYNVIQNLVDLESALVKFSAALRPGGLMLIAAPIPYSPTGLASRFSPHDVHVWLYRRIRGEEDAGLPGHGPFPVHYHPLVAPKRLKGFMSVRGFETVYERVYESPRYAELRAQRPALGTLADGITGLINLPLMGRTNVRRGDYHLVLRKSRGAKGSKD